MFDTGIGILIVDDMLTMRKLVKKALSGMGYREFFEAGDGAEAFDVLNNNAEKIKLIISDWNMPKCSGIEFLKRVRASERFRPLPFVMLTAESESGQVREALQAGVSNYIVKPFSADSMKEKLGQTYANMTKNARVS